ncbi:MAG TPA: hypothetical protein VJ904_01840 [Tichowtungia sp.]|nr:hypothetical protein [Tichowtungia sp.]
MKYHGWSIFELYPAFLWPAGVLLALVLICFIALRPLRKKGNKIAKYLTIVLPIVGWAIWHFYPSFTFKGTYHGEIRTHIEDEPELATIVIDESSLRIGTDEPVSVEYELDPFLRVLWLSEVLDGKQFAAKLGWNSITYSYFKTGPVKHYK